MKALTRSCVLGAAIVVLSSCHEESAIVEPYIVEVPQPPPSSEPALVQALADAYQVRSFDRFEPLFHADFWFFQHDQYHPIAMCRDRWLCIHRRLLSPDRIPPSEKNLPMELWLSSITIALTPTSMFEERSEYYASELNPNGLDPLRWRATRAQATAQIFFETQGETDYLVSWLTLFVVAEDRSKAAGEVGKFSFYRIEALDPIIETERELTTWGNVLALYDADTCPACPPPPVSRPGK